MQREAEGSNQYQIGSNRIDCVNDVPAQSIAVQQLQDLAPILQFCTAYACCVVIMGRGDAEVASARSRSGKIYKIVRCSVADLDKLWIRILF